MIDYTALAEALASIGAFGLVAWLLRRVFTHTIPRLTTSFSASLDKQAVIFREQLGEQQVLFQEELKQCRKDFSAELRSQREYFKEQNAEERKMFFSRMDSLTAAISYCARQQGFVPFDSAGKT